MSDKSLNSRVSAYKAAFASGELQKTYQDFVGIIQNLRTDFSKKYAGEYTIASLLHGYIDYTYFYLQNDYLKRHKLKFAIVFNHHHVHFELWLLGQTKDVQIAYWEKLQATTWVRQDEMPAWSIFEVVMLAKPDFDDVEKLTVSIQNSYEVLSNQIFDTLMAYE